PRLAADPASTAAPSGPGRGEAALAPRERRPWRGGVPRRRRFGRIPPAPTRRLGADHDRARRNPLRHRQRPRRPRRRHHPRLALGPAPLDPPLRLPRHRPPPSLRRLRPDPAAAIILVSLSARRSWTLDFVCLATAIASQAAAYVLTPQTVGSFELPLFLVNSTAFAVLVIIGAIRGSREQGFIDTAAQTLL